MFITFEGIDGSGKSTQIARTEAWLRGRGYDVLVSREPGGSELGEAIRDILLDPKWQAMVGKAEFFLYSASRAQLVEEIVRPHLKKPKAVVILDRYDDSSTAYQGGGREIGVESVETINCFATGSLEPDVTFILDLDWETSCARRAKAGEPSDRLEGNTREFFERVREVYRGLCARHRGRMILLDASQPEEVVFGRIQAELEPRL
jgi:dTMP kinase